MSKSLKVLLAIDKFFFWVSLCLSYVFLVFAIVSVPSLIYMMVTSIGEAPKYSWVVFLLLITLLSGVAVIVWRFSRENAINTVYFYRILTVGKEESPNEN